MRSNPALLALLVSVVACSSPIITDDPSLALEHATQPAHTRHLKPKAVIMPPRIHLSLSRLADPKPASGMALAVGTTGSAHRFNRLSPEDSSTIDGTFTDVAPSTQTHGTWALQHHPDDAEPSTWIVDQSLQQRFSLPSGGSWSHLLLADTAVVGLGYDVSPVLWVADHHGQVAGASWSHTNDALVLRSQSNTFQIWSLDVGGQQVQIRTAHGSSSELIREPPYAVSCVPYDPFLRWAQIGQKPWLIRVHDGRFHLYDPECVHHPRVIGPSLTNLFVSSTIFADGLVWVLSGPNARVDAFEFNNEMRHVVHLEPGGKIPAPEFISHRLAVETGAQAVWVALEDRLVAVPLHDLEPTNPVAWPGQFIAVAVAHR